MENDDSFSCDIDGLCIPYWIQCAENGCVKSARELLNAAAQDLKSGAGIHEKLIPYLVSAFEAIVDKEESADKALHLIGKQGVGKNSVQTYHDKRLIVARVNSLLASGKAKTVDEACEITHKILAKNDKYLELTTIRKYFYAFTKGSRYI